MEKTKRRDKTIIIIEILETAKKGVKPTNLMYRTNMNFNGLIRYANALIECGYLEETSRKYKTTPEGLEALKSLREASRVLGKFNEYWKQNI